MTRTVLIDNSIFSLGEFAETILVESPGYGNRLVLIQAKAALPPKHRWKQTQIEALPTVARLARQNVLAFYSYFELLAEDWRGHSFPAKIVGNVFRDAVITEVPAPVDRSLFVQSNMEQFVGKEAQIQFCKWLIANGAGLLKKPKALERLTEPQIAALKNIGRYREICHSLSPVQYVDALHLWTGELNGIEYFLTTDATLVRALSPNKRLVLRCKPIYPEDLLIELNVKDRERPPFEYGRRYYLNGIPFD
jgi:hypothetical protein